MQAREAECHFEGVKANPIPRQRPGQGVVRLNSAAILREDNLYRKKQENEARLLGAYEQELRDSSEFDEWQARMRAADEEARLKEVDRRRVETCARQHSRARAPAALARPALLACRAPPAPLAQTGAGCWPTRRRRRRACAS